MRQCGKYEVLVALNYSEAQHLVSLHGDDIFVAITDLNLPDAEDGAAAKLMSERGIPSVAFTGNFSPNLRETVLALGVSDYVWKHGQADIDYVVRIDNRMSANRSIRVLVADDAQSS